MNSTNNTMDNSTVEQRIFSSEEIEMLATNVTNILVFLMYVAMYGLMMPSKKLRGIHRSSLFIVAFMIILSNNHPLKSTIERSVRCSILAYMFFTRGYLLDFMFRIYTLSMLRDPYHINKYTLSYLIFYTYGESFFRTLYNVRDSRTKYCYKFVKTLGIVNILYTLIRDERPKTEIGIVAAITNLNIIGQDLF